MKRRRFLIMTTGGAALVGVGAAGGVWLFCPGPSVTDTAAAHLDGIARAMAGVAGAGRAWQAANPDAEPLTELLRRLELAPDTPIERDDLLQRLAERVERDFADDELFEHRRWLLSSTEAQLAALHVALLGADASEGTAPSFEDAPEAELVRLERYNPKEVTQGQPLTHPGLPENVMWFATQDPPPPRFRVFIDGTSMTVNARENGFSLRVPDPLRQRLYETPGAHAVWLYDPVVDRRQRLGTLTVIAAAGAAGDDAFCDVESWGPQRTRAGTPFNEQPDGASAFWIRVGCFPESTVVTLAGTEVKTTLRPADGLITTHIVDHSLYREPGEYAVELRDTETGRTHPVGTFVVQP
jgi:hypothetical protein